MVTGTPLLTLNTTPTHRVVNFTSVTANNARFDYTVQATDTASVLETLSTAALTLNGGTIKDIVGNVALLTLPTPTGAHSLSIGKTIVIDTTDPVAAIDTHPLAVTSE